MTGSSPDERPLNIKSLLGVGLDGKGKQTRITRGENFYLYGGSQKTHEKMTDICLRFSDEVDKRGKKLAEINARELGEISRKVRDD
jgi:hypothetical protein